MNLLFYDRSNSAPTGPTGRPLLSIDLNGQLVLSASAVQAYALAAHQWVSVAEDADTHTFYLVFGEAPGRQPFPLRLRDKKSASRAFTSAALARVLCQAFAVAPDAKRLRLALGSPLVHDTDRLFPLLDAAASPKQNQPVATPLAVSAPGTPELVTIADDSMTIAADSADAPQQDLPADGQPLAHIIASPKTAGGKTLLWSATDNAYLDTHYATTSMAELSAQLSRTAAAISYRASTRGLSKQTLAEHPAPASVAPPVAALEQPEPALEPAPRKTFGLMARAEELTTYWMERDIERTTPNELGEILNLLRHVARDRRGFEMDVVLERAEKEHTNRLGAAGKGGRNL